MADDTDVAIAGAEPDPEDHLALVALTPGDMPTQQRALSAWCDRKIALVERELATFVALQDEAIIGGFKHASYTNGVNRTAKRVEYYRKIKAAVDAGYLIVPNMPTRTFAVRVKRAKPKRVEGHYRSSVHDARPDLLPAGEGRYVDGTTFTESEESTELRDGKPVERVRYFSSAFDEDVDFPLRGVLPEVLRATSKAMALRLFDQLAIVRNDGGGRDPIVVGQLLDPRGNRRLTTFFVAWWLNTADL